MKKAGIYLHIPFCKSRCSYCDFATDVYKSAETVERYVNALVKEISDLRSQISDKQNFQISENQFGQNKTTAHRSLLTAYRFDTIYFGGGTPSLLSAKQLERILHTIYKKFSIEENSEITLEMNPATVSLETLEDYRSLGINRASFGVQTFNDTSLKLLARGHDADDARKTFELLRKSRFENISFDLIGGLPHQTLKDWEKNLDEALNLDPEHISLYLLEIHEGTPLAEQIRSKRQPMPDEDLAGEMYEMMLDKVRAKGFEQYEISNFAKPGFESKHNSKYWTLDPVFSFGCSAHSFDGQTTRWSNERDTAKYVSLIENGKSPIVEINKLTEKQLSGEFAFLNLRLTKGLDLIEFEQKFGIDLQTEIAEDIERFSQLHLIEIDENHLKLTEKGFVYSNEIFALFV